MKLPNREQAIIESRKLVAYLLDVEHPFGGSKARLLLSMGYSPDDWQRLATDLLAQHLSEDVIEITNSPWGERFEIVAPLTGPTGDTVTFRSIWQIDVGTDAPRLITMYPE